MAAESEGERARSILDYLFDELGLHRVTISMRTRQS
jgi:RimJ/RimL family protein N-acetyltransferase